jgi:branched-chain amino acid transport system substrate-binding protein
VQRFSVLVFCALCLSSCHEDSRAALRVGVLLPYSADTADYFRSMEIAITEVNTAGGVHGRPVELVLYDVMWDAEISFDAFNRAVDDGAVAVIGGLASFLARREADAAALRRIPLVGCCSTSDSLTTIQPPGDDRFFVRVAPPDRIQSVVLADQAYNRPGLACRDLGIVYVNDSYGIGLSESLAVAFEALGGTVAARVPHAFFSQSFTAEVATMALGNPDCIVLVSNVDDGRGFRKAWIDGGLPVVSWLGSDSMMGEALGETYADPHLSDGVEVVLPWSLGTPAADAFISTFEANYGRTPLPASVGTYDAAAILVLALAEADSLSGDDIRDAVFRVANAPGTPIGVGDLGEAIALIEGGRDVDYVGFSSKLELDACGDVVGDYALLRLDADLPGGYSLLETGLTALGVTSPCPP